MTERTLGILWVSSDFHIHAHVSAVTLRCAPPHTHTPRARAAGTDASETPALVKQRQEDVWVV